MIMSGALTCAWRAGVYGIVFCWSVLMWTLPRRVNLVQSPFH
jgi:hypothetical protein